jgi:group I intron endonuclease
MKIGNLEVYGVIYKITNLVNGKVYIGQTTKEKGFDERYSAKGNYIEKVYKYHKWKKEAKYPYNKHLLNSIEKYGFDFFKVNKILDIAFSKEELNIKEKCWISIYDSFKNGYNETTGGGDANTFLNKTEEEMNIIKDKISKANKGKLLGENNPIYGRHRTEEEKTKILETKIKNGNTSYIKQIDKETMTVIKVWNCISTAEKELRVFGIHNVLNENNRHALSVGGFYWEYIDKINSKYNKLRKKENINER